MHEADRCEARLDISLLRAYQNDDSAKDEVLELRPDDLDISAIHRQPS